MSNLKELFEGLNTTPRPFKYRIQKADGRFLNTGTGLDSWFTLEQAKALVNYDEGQRIVEHDGVNVLWEVL